MHEILTQGVPLGSTPTHPIPEKIARLRLGLNKDDIRALRQQHLKEGEHWVLHSKRVYLSPAGVELLFAAAGQKNAAASPSSIPAVPEALKDLPAEEVKLRVVKNNLANRYMVLACPADDDPDRPKQVVRVKVRNARSGPDMRENLIRRMEIPARLVARPDLYELARPMPRKKGQW